MDKILVYVLDTRKTSFHELLDYVNLEGEDLSFLDKYKVLEVKKEKLVSYYFRKKYVGEVFNNEYGKPLSKNIYFNISHSKGVIVIALSMDYDVGVDVEVVRPNDDDLVKYTCNEEEYRFVKNEFDFLSIWTNKESLVKCLGTGIKNKIKEIPGLPLNGKKEYGEDIYYSRVSRINDAILSITIKNDKEFDYQIIMEDVHHE